MEKEGTFSNAFCEAVPSYEKLDKSNTRNKKMPTNACHVHDTEVFNKILAKKKNSSNILKNDNTSWSCEV